MQLRIRVLQIVFDTPTAVSYAAAAAAAVVAAAAAAAAAAADISYEHYYIPGTRYWLVLLQ